MKKLYFTIACAILTISLSAQSLVSINPVNLSNGTLAEIGAAGNLEVAWAMQNISSNSLSVRCRREIISAVPGSTNYFCWGVCFQESTDISPVGVAVPMAAEETNNSFFGHYKPNGNVGQSTIRYCFFDNNNPSDEFCETVVYCVDVANCAVGVEENVTAKLESVSPNPTSGMTVLRYTLPSNSKSADLVMYSMTGALVRTESLISRQGMVVFDATEFASGVYFIGITVNGQTGTMQKLVVN